LESLHQLVQPTADHDLSSGLACGRDRFDAIHQERRWFLRYVHSREIGDGRTIRGIDASQHLPARQSGGDCFRSIHHTRKAALRCLFGLGVYVR